MKVSQIVKKGFAFLANTDKELAGLEKRSLEEVLEQYIKLLLLSGLVAAITGVLWTLGSALFYHLFRNVTVEYLRLLNYSLSLAGGTFFFYLFIGTFGLGALSLLLRPFVRKKYTELVKLLAAATTPVLLLGWVSPQIGAALLIWSLFILVRSATTRTGRSVRRA
jgi:hypothetical protein